MQTIVLDSTSKSLEAVLVDPVNSDQPEFICTYADDVNNTSFAEGSQEGELNGTTPVTLCDSPGAGTTRRIIRSLMLHNKDDAPITFYLRYVDGATARRGFQTTLQSGETFTLDGVYDVYGRIKTTTYDPLVTGDVLGPVSSVDNNVPRFDGVTGKQLQGSNMYLDDAGTVNIPVGQTYNIDGSPHTHDLLYPAISVVNEIDGNVDDLISLSGRPENSTHLGNSFGSIITPNTTILTALTELETYAEGITTDFDENAQDAVGGMVVDSSSIDFTYNDTANTLTAAVLPAGVDHDALSNFDTNEHVDHTTVSISAGGILSGGGNISANRTISLAHSDVDHDQTTNFRAEEHREINDAGTSLVELWSSSKISGEIASLSTGVFRKKTVLAIVDCTAVPPTEVLGDRYILDTTGPVNADWDGAAQNSIVEFDGALWNSVTPSEGWVAYVDGDDVDACFVDDGVPGWELRPAAINDHDLLTNTHNLSSDIDHDTITNSHNLTTDIDHDTISNTHNLTTDIDHDQLTNFVAGEHRIINDSGTSLTELWSANKINAENNTQNTAIASNTAHRNITTGNPHNLDYDDVGAEEALGNPTTDNYVLSSTVAGVRSWVEMSGGSSANLDDGSVTGQMAFWDETAGKWTNTEDTELFWDDANKRVGIGVNVPSEMLEVAGNVLARNTLGATTCKVLSVGGAATMYVERYSSDTGAPNFIGRKARGTEAVPEAIEQDDFIYNFLGQGYDGVSFRSCANIQIMAGENWNATSHGSYIRFRTTENGSEYSNTRAFLEGDGSWELLNNQMKNMVFHNDTIANIPLTGNEVDGQPFYAEDIQTLFIYETGWKPIISYGPVTLYVDALLGADTVGNGYASGADAFATVQHAINNVPPLNGGDVLINVAAGTYNEDIVVQGKSFSGEAELRIKGVIGDESSASITSSSNGSGYKNAYIDDSTASWVVDEHKGKLVSCTGRPDEYCIVADNTATRLNLVGRFGAPASGTYTLHTWDTIITPVADSMLIQGSQQNLFFDSLDITNNGVSNIAIKAQQYSKMEFWYCKILNQKTSYAVIANEDVVLKTNYCFVESQLYGLKANTSNQLRVNATLVKGQKNTGGTPGRPGVWANNTYTLVDWGTIIEDWETCLAGDGGATVDLSYVTLRHTQGGLWGTGIYIKNAWENDRGGRVTFDNLAAEWNEKISLTQGMVEINGPGSTSATQSILCKNNSADDMFAVRDDGVVEFFNHMGKDFVFHSDVIANLPSTGNEQSGQPFYATDIQTLFIYEGGWKPFMSFASVDIYVNGAIGVDIIGNGYTSGAGAFASVQYAIDNIPSINGGDINVHISTGVYNELVTIQGKYFSTTGTLTLEGELTSVESGTMTGFARGSDFNGVASVITDSSKTWIVNEHKGRVVYNPSSGKYALIASNTATTLSCLGDCFTSIISGNYTIYDRGTVFTAPSNSTNVQAIAQGSVKMDFLKFDNSAGVISNAQYNVLSLSGSYINMNCCHIDTDGGGFGARLGGVIECVNGWVQANAYGFRGYGTPTSRIDNTLIEKFYGVSSGTGVIAGSVSYVAVAKGSVIDGFHVNALSERGSSMGITGAYITNATQAGIKVANASLDVAGAESRVVFSGNVQDVLWEDRVYGGSSRIQGATATSSAYSLLCEDDGTFGEVFKVADDGGVHAVQLKSGTSQVAAGAVAGEFWQDTSDNTIKIGV